LGGECWVGRCSSGGCLGGVGDAREGDAEVGDNWVGAAREGDAEVGMPGGGPPGWTLTPAHPAGRHAGAGCPRRVLLHG